MLLFLLIFYFGLIFYGFFNIFRFKIVLLNFFVINFFRNFKLIRILEFR